MSETGYIRHDCDVVVIGGGAAGALAAIAAKKEGKSVAFITKESALVGGATVMAGGGTSVTMSGGDSGQVFFEDIMKSGQRINNRRLARLVADNAMNALYELESCDFLLDRHDLERHGSESVHAFKQGEGHSHPRAYLDRREALGFCHGISKSVMRHGIDIFTETVAVKLLKKDGAVRGAVCYDMANGRYVVFTCKAVIMAAGGLGGLYEETTNSSVLNGDGYAMAFEAGAQLVDMEMVQFMPLTFPYPKIRRGKIIGMCSLIGPDVKLYNGLGERYMHKYDPVRKEFTTRDIGARGNYTEIMEGRGTPNKTIIVDNRDFKPEILYRWQTTNPFRYRQCCQTFGMEAGNWEKPFEAIPSQHFFMGGVKINEHMETRVPGLFAVGEVTGGIHGANRLSGVAFAEIFSLGPIAGRQASKYAGENQAPSFDETELENAVTALESSLATDGDGPRPFELKQRIQKAMSSGLGPVRDGAGIKNALAELNAVVSDLPYMRIATGDQKYNREKMEALELPLMLRTARMVASAALERTESRGSHYRLDYPEKNDADWLKNIVISRGADGDIAVCAMPVEED